MKPLMSLIALATVLVLSGCATVDIDAALRETGSATAAFTQGKLELSRSDAQREARTALTEELLSGVVGPDEGVQLALANSPAVQALLARGWGDIASATQAGRIGNPVFSFERVRSGDSLELGRLLSVGLLDLITLPQRQELSRSQIAQAKVRLSAEVVDLVGRVRQTWVRAVAAQQTLGYAEQVHKAAEASAELARRMQQVGNFTRLQRAREHAFYADAAAQLASSRHAVVAAREELVRQLGLAEDQAARLQLPERLPDLPAAPLAAQQLTAAAMQQRLDVQLARLQLDAAGKSRGLKLLESRVDVELGVRRDTVFDAGERSNPRGYELEIRLPVFDWGDVRRASLDAQALAAANGYESVTRSASSQLRESYSAYRTAYDLARHYRDEIVPLRKTISEENMLRYNGMLIGVFDLLADTREQIASVMGAISAQQQFWLADAALASSLIGKPIASGAMPVSAGGGAAAADQAH